MTLLELLKYRLKLAKAFSKDFHERVKKDLENYNIEESNADTLEEVLNNNNKRYEFKIPYIFATHESMMASLFENVPDLIFRGRGRMDEEKKRKVIAAYDYIVDIVDMPLFMNSTAWWFILSGYCSGHPYFKSETREIPLIDPMTGQPVIDPMTGEQETRVEYIYDDPVLEVGNPLKEYFSPESKFSEDASKVPYYIREELMSLDEIKQVYGVTVKSDASLKIDGLDDDKSSLSEVKDDIKRAKVYFYYGQLPEKIAKDLKDIDEPWEYGKDYYLVFTNDKVIYSECVEKPCRIGKWHGAPTDFFGFGIGKLLAPFQKELSIRRGQQIRYADLAAFPKIAARQDLAIDEDALLDPRALPVLLYAEEPPQYLSPPEMSNNILVTEDKARQDAQFVSGMLDLSKGSQQSNMVETATGQSIFAKAAEKRMQQAKKQYGRFYKEVVISLLKLAQKHWSEDKLVMITDESGQDIEVQVGAQDLSDIDFDKDIDVDLENVEINQEVLRAQAIELYNKTKDDPLVNRKEIFTEMIRDGFNKKNPDRFLKTQEDLVAEQEMGQMPGMEMQAPPQPTPGDVPTDMSGIMGASQNV